MPIDTALLNISCYNLYTNFNPEDYHLGAKGIRGICVYVIDNIHATEVIYPKSSLTECLWIKIDLQGANHLIVGCVYCSPSVNHDLSIDELGGIFHEVIAAKPSHLLICGDFNVPQIDCVTNYWRAPNNHFSHKFVGIIQDCMLFQHATSPTRYREGDTPSMLDLLLTNEEGMITGLEYLPGLGKSDHIVLRFCLNCLNCYSTQTDMHQRKLNYHEADFKKLGDMLSDMDWDCLATMNIEMGYGSFKDALSFICSLCMCAANQSFQVQKELVYDK